MVGEHTLLRANDSLASSHWMRGSKMCKGSAVTRGTLAPCMYGAQNTSVTDFTGSISVEGCSERTNQHQWLFLGGVWQKMSHMPPQGSDAFACLPALTEVLAESQVRAGTHVASNIPMVKAGRWSNALVRQEAIVDAVRRATLLQTEFHFAVSL